MSSYIVLFWFWRRPASGCGSPCFKPAPCPLSLSLSEAKLTRRVNAKLTQTAYTMYQHLHRCFAVDSRGAASVRSLRQAQAERGKSRGEARDR